MKRAWSGVRGGGTLRKWAWSECCRRWRVCTSLMIIIYMYNSVRHSLLVTVIIRSVVVVRINRNGPDA